MLTTALFALALGLPAHGSLRTIPQVAFDARGPELSGAGWGLRLELVAWGRGDALAEVGDGEPAREGQRVRYVHGDLVEWYEQGTLGLEQGFTVLSRPGGGLEPLTLVHRLGGGYAAEVLPGDRDALFVRAGSPVRARYSGLKAWDARGRELEARLSPAPGGFVISVDDSQASYPVTVDPWITVQVAQLTGNDTVPNDNFGSATAISGDTVLVGAPHHNEGLEGAAGAAYVFERNQGGTNNWGQVAKLSGSVAQSELFGAAVELDGDTALVLSPWGISPAPDRISVFERNAGGANAWGKVDVLTIGLDAIDSFAVGGERIVMTSNTVDIGHGFFGDMLGMAYDANTGTLYGVDVDDHLVTIDPTTGEAIHIGSIGVPDVQGLAFDPLSNTLYGSTGKPLNGAQLVVIDTSTGDGTIVGIIGFSNVLGLAFDPNTGTLYGVADQFGDPLIVIDTATGEGTEVGPTGLPKVDGLAFDPGTDTLYACFKGGQGVQKAAIIDTTTGVGTHLGLVGFDNVLGLAFDTATGTLLGAEKSTTQLLAIDTATGAGSVIGPFSSLVENIGKLFVFERLVTGWTQVAEIIAGTPTEDQYLGSGVAISGDTIAATAVGSDDIHIFEPDPANPGDWIETQVLTPPLSNLGGEVAMDGTVLLASAYESSNDWVCVYERDLAGTWQLAASLQSSGPNPGSEGFGRALDVDGSLAAIGALYYGPTGGDEGAVFLFDRDQGGPGAWGEVALLTQPNSVPDEYFGLAVGAAGSYVVAGAANGLNGTSKLDRAFVYRVGFGSEAYCTAGTSANGCQALLSASGAASATAASGFSLQAGTVEGQKDGLFFFGTNGQQANSWGNGTSFQCVVPPVVRAPLMAGTGTIGACDGAFALDLNALWCPSCPSPAKNPGSGALVQAQLWYRDPASTSNQTTSLSDALQFSVGP